MNKSLRVALVAFIVGFTMLLHHPRVFAEQALTDVTCADPDGNEKTFSIGWDNSIKFFEGKGDIPRLYCEGGFAQPYTTYISDTLPADSPLRYYAGMRPSPEPSPSSSEVTPEPSPTPEPSIEPTPETSLTPTPEPSPTETVTPSPSPSLPSPSESSTPEPSPQPTLEPSPEPTPVPPIEPSQEPVESVSASIPPVEPSPTPSLDAQVVTLDVPTQLMAIPGFEELAKSVEAIMNIGSDMTQEQREESQSVVIGAVLVGQIAASIRRVK